MFNIYFLICKVNIISNLYILELESIASFKIEIQVIFPQIENCNLEEDGDGKFYKSEIYITNQDSKSANILFK